LGFYAGCVLSRYFTVHGRQRYFLFFFFFFKTGLPAVKTDRERHGASETRPTINHPTTDKEEEERNDPMNTTRNKKGRQQQQTKT
jgi:hypothetical protein